MSTQTVNALGNNQDLLNNYITQQQQAAAADAAAKSASDGTTGPTSTGLGGNFNTFLKILTTQLQNQDPTAATDTNQFTQELVQFAGVDVEVRYAELARSIEPAHQFGAEIVCALGRVLGHCSLPAIIGGQHTKREGRR